MGAGGCLPVNWTVHQFQSVNYNDLCLAPNIYLEHLGATRCGGVEGIVMDEMNLAR